MIEFNLINGFYIRLMNNHYGMGTLWCLLKRWLVFHSSPLCFMVNFEAKSQVTCIPPCPSQTTPSCSSSSKWTACCWSPKCDVLITFRWSHWVPTSLSTRNRYRKRWMNCHVWSTRSLWMVRSKLSWPQVIVPSRGGFWQFSRQNRLTVCRWLRRKACLHGPFTLFRFYRSSRNRRFSWRRS